MDEVEIVHERMEEEQIDTGILEEVEDEDQEPVILGENINKNKHGEKLLKMCRICGTNDLQHGTKSKESFRKEIMDLFLIDIEFDNPHIHPNAICRCHEKLLQRFAKAQREKTPFRTGVHPAEFLPHPITGVCQICNPVIRRKRKRRGTLKTSIKVYPYADLNANQNGHFEPPTLNDITHIDNNTTPNPELKITSDDVFNSFLKLDQTEKATFLSRLINEIPYDELTKLSFTIGKHQNQNILKDCEIVSRQYHCREKLLELNPIEWLSDRNKVLRNFMTGIMGEDIEFTNQMDKNDAFLFCRTLEYLYNLRSKKLVAPFAFLVSLDIYCKTSSRTAIDSLGKSSPGGSYKTLKQWLASYEDTIPVCPNGTLITAFDNEQVIGYKRGLGTGSKSLSSVITTVVNAEMQDCSNFKIQSDELLKPKNWFSTTFFDEKLKTINENNQDFERRECIERDKNSFIGEVKKIRDSNLPENNHLEKLHYEQLYFFLTKVIKDVSKEQEYKNENIIDYIDKQIYDEERERDIIICASCGAENARRKLICDNCKTRDGIKQTRQNQNRWNKDDNINTTTGSIEINLEKIQDAEENRYEHVPSNHKRKTILSMVQPVFVNPNSNESVALVLRHIGINSGIRKYTGTEREWTFICCDGRPHSLYQKLLNDCVVCTVCNQSFLTRKAYRDHHKEEHANHKPSCSREFDWLYLRIGLGHYEMNIIKSFFELNWVPFLESMCEILKFNSEKAKNFAKTCKDHHIAWQLLLVFHTTALKEMMVPFVRLMMRKEETPTPEKYLMFFKEVMSSNPRWAYLHLQVCRFSQAIINLRMGIRRNNHDLVQSAKFHLKELFYGRSHPHYQNIELFDTLQYHFMPSEVRKVWDANISFTVSGKKSKGQDMDFLLEEKNRAVKQFIPSGSVPSEQTWDSICCNLQYIEDLQTVMSSWFGKQKMGHFQTKKIDIQDAVNSFRQTIRTYLTPSNESFDALNGKPLHPDLLHFLEISTAKRMNYINTTVLNEEPSAVINQNEPVYVSEEEQKGHLSKLSKVEILKKIENLINDELEDSILRSHYNNVLESIGGGQMKKDVYLTLYYEVKDVIDSSSDILENETVDYET